MGRRKLAQLVVVVLVTIPAVPGAQGKEDLPRETAPPVDPILEDESLGDLRGGKDITSWYKDWQKSPNYHKDWKKSAFVAGVYGGYWDHEDRSEEWHEETLWVMKRGRGYSSEIKTTYQEGREKGRRLRRYRSEQYQPFRERLAADYGGDWDKVASWETGYRDGRERPTPSPGRETLASPHQYHAYITGYTVGKRVTARERDELTIEPHPSKADELSAAYVAQLDTLYMLSEQEYLILEATNNALEILVSEDLPLDVLIGRTRVALEQAREANRIHLELDAETSITADLHRLTVEAIEGLAAESIAAIQELEFAEFKSSLHASTDAIAAEARRLKGEEVVLPEAFGEMTRYINEFIVVLTRSLETYEVRSTLAGKGLDHDALLAAMGEYQQLAKAWQHDHLTTWRQDRLRRLYPDWHRPPSDLQERATRVIQQFLGALSIPMTMTGEEADEAVSEAEDAPAEVQIKTTPKRSLLRRVAFWFVVVVTGIVCYGIVLYMLANGDEWCPGWPLSRDAQNLLAGLFGVGVPGLIVVYLLSCWAPWVFVPALCIGGYVTTAILLEEAGAPTLCRFAATVAPPILGLFYLIYILS